MLGLYRLVKGIVLAREKFLASLRDSINVPPFGTPRGTHATRQGTHGTVDPYDERDVPGTRLGYKVEQEGGQGTQVWIIDGGTKVEPSS